MGSRFGTSSGDSMSVIYIVSICIWILCSLGAFVKYSSIYKRHGWPAYSSRPVLVILGMCCAGPISLLAAVSGSLVLVMIWLLRSDNGNAKHQSANSNLER